jgi:hypothetical protein
MRQKAALLALAVFALIIGCATTPTVSYDRVLARWTGSPAEDLVRAWGPPNLTLSIEGGRQLYVYEERHTAIEPPAAPSGGPTGAGLSNPGWRPLTLDRWCRTTFEVEASAKIVGSHYAGNACGARR